MPKLVFHSDAGDASVAVAHTLAISVGGGKLSAGGPVLASYSGGVWRIGDVALSGITCEGPIQLEIHVANGPRTLGLFADLVIYGNTIWSAGAIFARWSALTNAWHLETKGKAAPPNVSLDVELVPV
jgi:hypothetical protein